MKSKVKSKKPHQPHRVFSPGLVSEITSTRTNYAMIMVYFVTRAQQLHLKVKGLIEVPRMR